MPIAINGSGTITGISAGGLPDAIVAKDDMATSFYEEGTFTPTLIGLTTSGTGTYVADGRVGRYTKIGNRVFFDIYLSWSAHTGTGNMEITGLPFTVQNTTNCNRTYSVIFSAITLTAGNVGAAFSSPNTTVIALRQLPSGGGAVASVPMDTSGAFSITGCFEV